MKSKAAKIQQHFQHATDSHQNNQFAEAQVYYEKVLRAQPNHSDAWHLLGLVKAEQGNLDDGRKAIKRAIQLQPRNPIYRVNEGLLFCRSKQWKEAIESYKTALSLDPNNLPAALNLADAFLEIQEPEHAIPFYQKVVAAQPNAFKAWHNLGNAYLATKAYDSALAAYDRVLQIQPQLVETLANKGVVYFEKKLFAQAVEHYQNALRVNPRFVSAYNNLGSAYAHLSQWENAEKAFHQALYYDPENYETYNSWGNCCKQQGEFLKAKECFEKTVQLNPAFPEGEFNLAITELLLGDFTNGWRHYESRHQLKEHRKTDYHLPQPFWQGESLQGKTLLILAEQGLGDMLQFIRFVPLLQKQAQPQHIIFECQPPLITLLQANYPEMTVVPRGQIPEHFDVQIRLMSLPYLLGLQIDSIPFTSGYLLPPEKAEPSWPKSLTEKSSTRKIGLVWGGSLDNPNDANRSLKLEQLKQLLDIPDTQWFSLQFGQQQKDIRESHLEDVLIDLSPYIHNFSDTALIMKELDLVVTVDTAPAHLAGALNCPVCLLISFAPDFRWLLDRSDSIWYESITLYRQPKPDDWEGALMQLKHDLSSGEIAKMGTLNNIV